MSNRIEEINKSGKRKKLSHTTTEIDLADHGKRGLAKSITKSTEIAYSTEISFKIVRIRGKITKKRQPLDS